MSVEATVLSGRVAAEARMLDTFDIGVPTGGWVFDSDVGEDVQAITPLFTTKGRVKVGGGLAARPSEVGDREAVRVTRELHIPATSPAVPPGAIAVATAVSPVSDPTLLGARLRLVGAAPGSQMTARRLQVTEIVT